ncbi:lymphocyte-specific protein 1 isoform X2 [Phocoena sinus]|uniref:lymphocyte-specific protein 1 isoform X2 n=1 Tax=Phocoena sinus TaxID=42100 RepID=UPI0013C4E89B|nr:lymphocyte-specific protein 1 isoform X2 [Phocoena sinus]
MAKPLHPQNDRSQGVRDEGAPRRKGWGLRVGGSGGTNGVEASGRGSRCSVHVGTQGSLGGRSQEQTDRWSDARLHLQPRWADRFGRRADPGTRLRKRTPLVPTAGRATCGALGRGRWTQGSAQEEGEGVAEAPAGASHRSRVLERARAWPRERSEDCARQSQLGSAASGSPGGPSGARRRLGRARGCGWSWCCAVSPRVPSPGGRPGLATQWSVEGEEGAALGQRQQERAQDEGEGGQSLEQLEQEKLLSPKPSEGPELDEDEGFGDWSQKPEQRRQHCGAGETADGGAPPRGESPDGGQEEDRPCQHTFGSQGGDELTPAGVCLEELRLSPDSEPQEGPGTEDTEPKGPEGAVQGSPGLAETKEAEDEQLPHQRCQRRGTPSPLVLEGTDPGSPPLSPSTKLSDRTESLHRSIQKSNSMKKSQPALPISTIEDRLEQYTQAIETSGRTPKLARQPSIELPSMAVASTKSRWETGEVQAQSSAKSPACKDIVAGDLSKRNLWEQKGSPKASPMLKSTPSAKRYKFVATGHGKYEKVLVDEGSAP